jgi:hypothetical protein
MDLAAAFLVAYSGTISGSIGAAVDDTSILHHHFIT